ncbi:hypothetical protein ACGFX4_30655 [Kitasatospora sp. NPDC048365]|uniref:hypothetical protein n=1 Tax=Kitasatospora sp. NPDC048365 TaxID=3364050 RepID=UPI00371B0D7B
MSNNRTPPYGVIELLDPDDNRWHFVRGPLDLRAAKRLVLTAHTVLEGYLHCPDPEHLTVVADTDRRTFWQTIKRGLEDRQGEVYHVAYEFGSAEGRRMVFLNRHC